MAPGEIQKTRKACYTFMSKKKKKQKKQKKQYHSFLEWDTCNNTTSSFDENETATVSSDIISQLEKTGNDILTAPNIGTENPKETASQSKSPFSANLLAEDIMEHYDFMTVDGQLYVYIEDYGYWKLLEESNSNRELRKLIPDKYLDKINKNVLSELFEWLIIKSENKPSSIFNNNRFFFNFRNGALNWKKGKLTEKRKKLYFRHVLDTDYVEAKSSGKWRSFLDDIFEDDKDSRKEFYKFVGLCLSEIRNLKLSFILYGPSNTGKSLTLNLIRKIAGEENCSALSFSQFANDFAIVALNGKSINISGEISGTTNARLDIFKSVCGNDKIFGSRKFKDYLPFENSCLLVFASNVLPTITDPLEYQSFAERIIIFPFAHPVQREKWDNKLLEKLLKDTPGIIECAIEGLKKLEADNFTFHESKAMLEHKHYYSGMYDSFSLFCNEYIVADKDGKVSSADISKTYETFCSINDYIPLKSNQWSMVLKRNFLCRSSTISVKLENGIEKRLRAYKGISLRKSAYKLLEKDNIYESITPTF